MKTALIYFSLSGNTEEIACNIAKDIGADIFRVEMKKPLPNVIWKQILIGGRQSLFGEKPKIYGLPESVSDYDAVIIGTPIWAGKVASPINTVLANRDIAQKVVAVFTLSGSGDNTKCIENLKKRLPMLQKTVSLADKKSELAKENAKKIKEFEKSCIRISLEVK